MDLQTIIGYGLRYLKESSMKEETFIENQEEITHSLLHDIKNMVCDVQKLKAKTEELKLRMEVQIIDNHNLKHLLEDLCDAQHERLKIPHRCPVCNGSTFDEENALCHICDGKGLVWG